MSGDKIQGKPLPCPGCGEEPRMDPKQPSKGHRHCKDSHTCTWAKCPICKTTWDIDTGRNFNE